jgi:hypothetical protein
MEFNAGQQWDVEFYHGDDHRLRFREVLKRNRFGKWRMVAGKKYWAIKPGKTSGLPSNLFMPLNEAIIGSINKIFREKRKLPELRHRTRSILTRAAGKTFCRCAAEVESKTLVKFILHHKPFVHFLIVNFQEHGPDEFFLLHPNGSFLKNKWGRPRRDVGKLADAIRQDKSTGLRKLEHESKAPLRWVVVFLADGNVWLVPAKASKERKR